MELPNVDRVKEITNAMPTYRSFSANLGITEGSDTNQPITDTARGIPDSIDYVIRGLDQAGMIILFAGGSQL